MYIKPINFYFGYMCKRLEEAGPFSSGHHHVCSERSRGMCEACDDNKIMEGKEFWCSDCSPSGRQGQEAYKDYPGPR